MTSQPLVRRDLLSGSFLRSEPCPAGTALTERGVYWVVRSGLVRLTWRGERRGARSVLVDVFGPGAVASVPRDGGHHTLQATAGTELIRVAPGDLERLALADPGSLIVLVHALDRQKRNVQARYGVVRRTGAEGQLEGMLALLAKELGRPCTHGRIGCVDVLGISHQDLADLIGSSRPYVSTLVTRFVKDRRLLEAGARMLCLSRGKGSA